jgi:hypothetical protein
VDTAEQFDASYRDDGRCEVLEAEHGSDSALDAPVILFNRLFRYFEERSFMRLESKPSVRISRT